ncbi:MAG: 4-hydroxybenzoate octaprenyltransferase [Legionella sp.]|nr:MAG: 4-hydroxybenzoate octaprenyltransferase [Legionella sp.]
MRFDKPAGIALLWAPTAWALWLANQGHPPWILIVYFLLGTILMRAAGCIINDMADRRIDKHVKRTQTRPITSGELPMHRAAVALFVLLCLAAGIMFQLPVLCWVEAVIALAITVVYPFGKRFLSAPQLVLGVAFSMGIPMAYAASHVALDSRAFVLIVLNFLWIVAYDTMYAMMDRDDDRRIGVRSTAILFGSQAFLVVMGLQVLVHGLWLVLAGFYAVSFWFFLCWLAALGIILYQYYLLKQQTTKQIMQAFLWNAVYGLVMWIGLLG